MDRLKVEHVEDIQQFSCLLHTDKPTPTPQKSRVVVHCVEAITLCVYVIDNYR